MATRGRKASAKTDAVSASMLDALRFVACGTRPDGLPHQTHAFIAAGNVTTFDGAIQACHPIDSDLTVAPHLANLITALGRCDSTIAITVTDGGKLSIKSGKLRALVECLPVVQMQLTVPDTPCASIDDRLKAGFAAVSVCADETNPVVKFRAIALGRDFVTATDSRIVMQYWHGIDLPFVLIPKETAQVISKITKPLKSFGFSDNSATFYFDDHSYIKTALYAADYPQIDRIMCGPDNCWPIPSGFFEAVENIAPFADDIGAIHLSPTMVSTHPKGLTGATYEIEGLPDKKAFAAKYLKLIKPHAQKIFWGEHQMSNLTFYGDKIRGAIAPIRVNQTEETTYNKPVKSSDDMEDDIPF